MKETIEILEAMEKHAWEMSQFYRRQGNETQYKFYFGGCNAYRAAKQLLTDKNFRADMKSIFIEND